MHSLSRVDNQAVSEKIKNGESPKDAIIRGIKEDLGIEGEVEIVQNDTNEIFNIYNLFFSHKRMYIFS